MGTFQGGCEIYGFGRWPYLRRTLVSFGLDDPCARWVLNIPVTWFNRTHTHTHTHTRRPMLNDYVTSDKLHTNKQTDMQTPIFPGVHLKSRRERCLPDGCCSFAWSLVVWVLLQLFVCFLVRLFCESQTTKGSQVADGVAVWTKLDQLVACCIKYWHGTCGGICGTP